MDNPMIKEFDAAAVRAHLERAQAEVADALAGVTAKDMMTLALSVDLAEVLLRQVRRSLDAHKVTL